ncbi:activator of hsp90 atpase 1 family protein, partial [Cardiosporidium cionae]
KPKIGSRFKLMGGNVEGDIVALEKDSLITQRWRFHDWKEGNYSTVHITFTQLEEGKTEVHILQQGIPVEDKFGNC